MYLTIYFFIGLIAFVAFWRWMATDKPGETAETFIGLLFLLAWPAVLLGLLMSGFYLLTVKIAQKVQKVNSHEETNV
ncbi:hypothetical protein [Cronobacter malonaticus]|uniref:hypothetical protein n=1 Tax=Cronobacter malonaticus TaxID=413503 RepID=UPI000CFDFFF8|nr:hypothetical protein [Cronobacter malonaticus]